MSARAVAILGAGLLLAGCASRDLVVILPPEPGHQVGGVVVHPNKGPDVLLDKAYASDHPGDSHVGMETAESVDKQFHDVIEARPIPPKTYNPLYFKSDSFTELSPESDAYLRQILTEFSARVAAKQAVEIVVTGHADKTSTPSHKLELSQQRADAIKARIKGQGVDESAIQTVARGQLDATGPDGQPFDKDRYVEITVR
ncbi:MAG: OmpA family protein [Alphaproteobacteria bacterium]